VTCRRLTEAAYCQHYALSYQIPKTCSPSLKHRLVSSLPKSSGSSRTWNATSASLRCTSPIRPSSRNGTRQLSVPRISPDPSRPSWRDPLPMHVWRAAIGQSWGEVLV
jgi:hypothetical protein